jgi:ribosome-associated heat shock protein Hsp15
MAAEAASEASLRVDKWLWYARFFKSRTRASEFCASGKLRVSGEIVRKAHRPLHVGDVLTFPHGLRIRVVRVKALAERRGPAAAAEKLYDDLAPATPLLDDAVRGATVARRARGAGRPTKVERRAIARLKAVD